MDVALPFGVRDSGGTLLLQAGARIVNQDQLAYLRSKSLFADEHESTEWRRKLGASMGAMLRQNAPQAYWDGAVRMLLRDEPETIA